ncbi:MAG: cob(I)yrinic acid a,c-diamide adenosyltransferase [Verrucomicrobia bacterium]|nr:cob(I)yrinic acid a,c-diamide adenosyltransferase [Verrucomicrobiota bacterium]
MKARTLLFTGEGKGKTTAALGMVLRAAGHGQRVLVVQFIKADATTGELAACKNLPGVRIVQMGRGFVPRENSPAFAAHREAAAQALEFAAQAVASADWDLIVLDEICAAVAKKLISEDSVLQLLDRRTRPVCLVLTGRDATERLIAAADTVTEMKCVKHGLKQGIKAQKGVEF